MNVEDAMEPIQIGQRVRVVNRRLVHYRQVGTVIGVGSDGGFYVQLDYDEERLDTGTFFHGEELEPALETPASVPRPAHRSLEAQGEDRWARPPLEQHAAQEQVAAAIGLRAQAARLSEQAAHMTARAAQARDNAAQLDAEAQQLHERAADLYARAEQLHERGTDQHTEP
jgi:hypothetical protein